jgi:hypothetical protein
MSDSLQKLIKDMERPLSSKEISFLRLLDEEKPEFFTAEFILPDNPFQTKSGFFQFEFSSKPPIFRTVNIDWSPGFERELFKRHIKMARPEQEAIRGSMLLLSNLRFPGVKFGEDYTNAVLAEVIKERFGKIQVVADLLSDIREYNPNKGVSYSECRDYLRSAINGYGNSLVFELKYKDNTAFAILVGAVVAMLDKRFRISLRKTLFPK